MKSLVKLAMLLCFVAITLLCPASLTLTGSDSALAGQAGDDILDFIPAIVAKKKAPILQTPTVNGTSITLTWTFNYWPSLVTTNEGYRLEESTSPTGPFSQIAQIAGRQTPKSYILTRNAGTYYYRVRVFYNLPNNLYSPYSNVVSATVTGPTVVKTTEFVSVDNKLVYDSTNSSIGNTVYGNTDLAVGIQWAYIFSQDFIVNRTVLWFNIQSKISGKTINRAILKLYPYILPADYSTTYGLMALAQTWSGATVTSNNFDSPLVYTAVEKVLPPPVTTAVPLEIDVTDIVQYWANGTMINYGFYLWDRNSSFPYTNALRATGFESNEYYYNINRRPQLYLEYQ
jgi:hypothetical protein